MTATNRLTRSGAAMASFILVAQPAPPPPGAAPAPRPANSSAIQVIDANLGNLDSYQVCNALASVKRQCEGRASCTLSVSKQLCASAGAAPPLLILSLVVNYRCWESDKPRIASANQPFDLRLSCPLSFPR
jgi:hypothetical protein